MKPARAATRVVFPSHLDLFRAASLSQRPVSQGSRRTNSPHEFYRYPARFSPEFAHAAIRSFSSKADLVLDPFVGGGTTLVEAMRLGRRSLGADLNELATYVTSVKTSVLSEVDFILIRRWVASLPSVLELRSPAPSLHEWRIRGYLKDLDTAEAWRVRSLVAHALSSLDTIRSQRAREFARCVVLRTAQWALDMRNDIPTVEQFRSAMTTHGEAMLAAAQVFVDQLADDYFEPTIITQGSPGLADHPDVSGRRAQLVLTSPPYPGVYVIYHRWKLRGRREISAPYWIADRSDGLGMANYTMSARSDKTQDRYFEKLTGAFTDIRRVTAEDGYVVQVVGFNNVASQLDRYLAAMSQAGFTEVRLEELATAEDGRLWRPVPGRRWWTTTTSMQEVAPHTSREVVLVHRPTLPTHR